jgi:hypothetical protein
MKFLTAFLIAVCLSATVHAQIMGTGHRSVGSSPPTMSYVQEKNCIWNPGSGITESCALPTAPTATDAIVAIVSWQTITSTLSTVQNASAVSYTNTAWASGAGACTAGGGSSLLYSLPNSAGGTNAGNITATFSADPGFGTIQLMEISGVATSGLIDVADCQQQGGTLTPQSPSVTTSAGDFLIGDVFDANASGGNTWSAGTPPSYTFVGTSNSIFGMEFFIQSASATVAAHFVNTIGYGSPQTMIVGLNP